MKRLADLMRNEERSLAQSLHAYVLEGGYAEHASFLEETWSSSVSHLLRAFIQACTLRIDSSGLAPSADCAEDPAARFAAAEARAHRERGIRIDMFLGLLKVYRQAYQDRIVRARFDPGLETRCRTFVDRFFDRIESVLSTQQAAAADERRPEELRTGHGALPEEKRAYSAVFESLADPHTRAEEALRRTQETLRSIFRAAPIGIGLAENRVLQWVNERMCALLQYSEEELVGQSARFLYPSQEEFDRVGQAKHGLIRKEGFGSIETRLKRKDGEIIHVILSSAYLEPSDTATGTIFSFLDITERKRALDALKQNEAKYRAMFESTSNGIAVYRAVDRGNDFVFADMNTAAERIEGVRRGDILGKSVLQVFPGVRELGLFDVFRRVFATGEPERLPAQLYRDERLVGWRDNYVYKLPTGEVVAMYSDETERKRQEARIEHVNAILRAIRSVSQLIVREKDRDTLLQAVCDSMTETRGYYDTWILLTGETTEVSKFASTRSDAMRRRMTHYLEGGHTPVCATRALSEPGVVVTAGSRPACGGCPVSEYGIGRRCVATRLEHGGTLYGVLGVSVPAHLLEDTEEQVLFEALAGDIAYALHGIELEKQRKKGEEELRKFERIISTVRDPMSFIDRDYVYRTVNDAYIQIFDRPREEIEGRYVYELLGKKFFYTRLKDRLDLCLSGKEVRYEDWFVFADGRNHYLAVDYYPLFGPDKSVLGVVSHARDITQLKLAEEEKSRLETQLRQAQKMEAIGTLAGGIAHDFNNILAAILGYTELALDDAPWDSPLRPNLDQVLNAALRARNLVRQILSFSRQAKQERSPIRTAPIVKEALKLLRATLPATIDIREKVDPDSGTVLADPTQIHQLLVNLCANAAHAMREQGGVLEVGLTRVDLGEDAAALDADLRPGPYQRITVADTGPGMDTATKERIFEPFFTTKETGEGTGMGLAVVHGIVKSHEGSVTVHSEPGAGTVFHVYLPLLDREEPENAPADTEPVPTGTERILFVDDEEAIADLGREALERLGYRVTICTSGVEALGVFKARPHDFDLVITDQTMPHLTGIDLTREILRIRPGIPIVLCTGYSGRVDPDTAAEVGIRRFVLKPLVIRDVAEVIRDVLDGDA